MAQTRRNHVPNLAYRPTVYETGVTGYELSRYVYGMNKLQLNQNMTTDCHFIYAYQIVKKQSA